MPNQHPHAQAMEHAYDAASAARIGLEHIEELRAVLRALWKLSAEDEVIRELARVGVSLANDKHNALDCLREDLEQKLLTLKGASHA